MGLIKAISGAMGGVLSDQWKDYYYCDSLDSNILVKRGQRRVSSRSSNYKGNPNIISNGSIIAVADGQCMMIVEQGRVIEFSAEPGEYLFDSSSESSIFAGKFDSSSISELFKSIGSRFGFGGDVANDQRVYYFNTKEFTGNRYGTPAPVPFRIVDHNIGLDLDITIRCFGEYSYRIVNPLLFYTNVSGNVENSYTRDQIDSQLKSELLTSFQPAFAEISKLGIRYSSLPAHTVELAESLNRILSSQWRDTRGIEIASLGISSVKASEKDEEIIKELQRSATFKDPMMAAAQLVSSQSIAMQEAAKNPNAGPAMAFMGMNMAQQSGGVDAHSLYAMGSKQKENITQPVDGLNSWKCECESINTGKFCSQCGLKKEVQNNSEWVCECGTVNENGKFCSECGQKRVESSKLKCPNCGWESEPHNQKVKFCPECGHKF